MTELDRRNVSKNNEENAPPRGYGIPPFMRGRHRVAQTRQACRHLAGIRQVARALGRESKGESVGTEVGNSAIAEMFLGSASVDSTDVLQRDDTSPAFPVPR